jgi:RNA polymerase sigma-70 factor, ECF subfamily
MYKRCDTTLSCYLDSLYRYAIVLTRNSTTASDLVQETYVRAFAAKERLWAESNIKAWLFTILRNIRLNDLRRHRTAPATVELDTDERTFEMAVEKSQNPHELYVAKLERLQVREAIRRLPENFREIIILREYEEMSYEDIANVLGCPVGTVMSRLARARSKLKALLSIPSKAFRPDGVRSENESM